MSLSIWLVCAEVPGLERRAMKKMSVDEAELLAQLHRWRNEAEKRPDCRVSRICVSYEAGRDGFWLARCLRGSGIEAYVIHSTSIPVKRDHRRASPVFGCASPARKAFPLPWRSRQHPGLDGYHISPQCETRQSRSWLWLPAASDRVCGAALPTCSGSHVPQAEFG